MKTAIFLTFVMTCLVGNVFAASSTFQNIPSTNYDIICDWGNYYISLTTSTPVVGYPENAGQFTHSQIPSRNNTPGYIFKIASKELYAALLAAKINGQTIKFLLVADGAGNLQMSWDNQNVTWNAVQAAIN